MVRTLPCFVLAACFAATAPRSVEAASITFSSGAFDRIGIGNIEGGDADELHLSAVASSGLFTITEADGVVHKVVNPFLFVVGDTGPGSDAFTVPDFPVTRTFTVNGIVKSISQDARVDIGFSGDSLLFLLGETVTFDLGAQGMLDVTPDVWDSFGELDVDDHFGELTVSLRLHDVPGTADVPEPTSMVLLGTGLAGAGLRRWRKQRNVR